MQDKHLFAGLHEFQTLPNVPFLAGWAIAEAVDARALLFDLACHIPILLLIFANQAAFFHQAGNALWALQCNKRIAGE